MVFSHLGATDEGFHGSGLSLTMSSTVIVSFLHAWEVR